MSRAGEPFGLPVTLDDGTEVATIFEPAVDADASTLFVCAHGAGGHMDDRAMQAASGEQRRRGAAVLRFNFPYSERKSRRPDPMAQLMTCFATVMAHARETIACDRLLIGGRSMGGRVASLLAADGLACDGLVLLAYPLHPAGQPGKLRDQHLPRINAPVLCINGTRDALCMRDRMEQTLARLADNWTMHWLDGADHSFHALKSSGRTDVDVMTEVGDAFARWLARLREK